MTVRLLHGTTAEAARLARRRGAWLPHDPARVAAQVADSVGLDPGALLTHVCMSQSAGRASDPHLYLTGCEKTARTYALLGSEMLSDALTAAWHLLHPDTNPEPSDHAQARARLRERKARQSQWAARWREEHGVRPAVVEFELAEADIERSFGYQHYLSGPGEKAAAGTWLSWCTDEGRDPVRCLMLPCPVTCAWTDVSDRALPAGENDAAALSR